MDGDLKGTDSMGNQYYENLARLPGRQRFVIYAGWGKGYDPSQVPPEWHHWLHNTTDRTPVERPVKPHPYQLPHQQMRLSQYGFEGSPTHTAHRSAPLALLTEPGSLATSSSVFRGVVRQLRAAGFVGARATQAALGVQRLGEGQGEGEGQQWHSAARVNVMARRGDDERTMAGQSRCR